MSYTDNPLRDADRHDREQMRWLKRRPVCRGCGEPIQEDRCYHYGEDRYHLDCHEQLAKRILAEYVGGTTDD